jgi:hypothetical protein
MNMPLIDGSNIADSLFSAWASVSLAFRIATWLPWSQLVAAMSVAAIGGWTMRAQRDKPRSAVRQPSEPEQQHPDTTPLTRQQRAVCAVAFVCSLWLGLSASPWVQLATVVLAAVSCGWFGRGLHDAARGNRKLDIRRTPETRVSVTLGSDQ